jgi:hypothetical protein
MSNPFHASLISDSYGIIYTAGERTLHPVTLIVTKHCKVGALELTLPEVIPFTSLPAIKVASLSAQTTDNAVKGERKETEHGRFNGGCASYYDMVLSSSVILLSLSFLT